MSSERTDSFISRLTPFALDYSPIPIHTNQLEKKQITSTTNESSSSSLSSSTSSSLSVGHFFGRHLLSVSSLNRMELIHLFTIAESMAKVVNESGKTNLAHGCIMATVFYEPSTRTNFSFQSAMMRLGGEVMNLAEVKSSSIAKGETIEDTFRCLQCYANIVVMRHPEVGSAARAASVLKIPLINAGDGIGEHPTQAILDLFTIQKECGRVDGLTITMVGDMKHGRTVHSLAKLLIHFQNLTLNFVSPKQLELDEEIQQILKTNNINFSIRNSLDEVMKDTDVLYSQHNNCKEKNQILAMFNSLYSHSTLNCATIFLVSLVTRIQKERFSSLSAYDEVKDSFILTRDLLDRLGSKASLRILHPLPRVNEISTDVDDDPRAAYFRQMKYGLYVRMAIIACLIGKA